MLQTNIKMLLDAGKSIKDISSALNKNLETVPGLTRNQQYDTRGATTVRRSNGLKKLKRNINIILNQL